MSTRRTPPAEHCQIELGEPLGVKQEVQFDDGRWEQVEGPLDSHVYALVTADGSLFAGLGDGAAAERRSW